jgi:sucrose-6F-phosphate phosphohydrolase
MQFLLITDLDNTLVGDDQATTTLNQTLWAIRHQFYLIYATGRSYRSAQELKAQKQLLAPDYWVTGVGTEIYHQHIPDLVWAEQLSLNWNRQAIARLAQSYPDLVPQPSLEQNPWKISFCINPSQASPILNNLHSQIDRLGLAAQIIFSSGRDVDIVPINANKGRAIAYLRALLGTSLRKTLVCGDSGNDISLFEQSTLGTIVKNAQPELIDWYLANPQPHLYLSPSPYAWGILDGLRYFNLLA